MCFLTLKQSFNFCSLRIGMYIICVISLVWNVGYYFDERKSPPYFLEILDSQNFIQLSNGRHFVEYRQYYYIIQIVVTIFAFIGTLINSPRFLNPLIMSEQLIFFMYVFATLQYANKYYLRFSEGESIFTTDIILHAIPFPALSALHFYMCSIIFSFFVELLKGNEGSNVTTSTLESDSLSLSRHGVQIPYEPTNTQSLVWMYPPNFLRS